MRRDVVPRQKREQLRVQIDLAEKVQAFDLFDRKRDAFAGGRARWFARLVLIVRDALAGGFFEKERVLSPAQASAGEDVIGPLHELGG